VQEEIWTSLSPNPTKTREGSTRGLADYLPIGQKTLAAGRLDSSWIPLGRQGDRPVTAYVTLVPMAGLTRKEGFPVYGLGGHKGTPSLDTCLLRSGNGEFVVE